VIGNGQIKMKEWMIQLIENFREKIKNYPNLQDICSRSLYDLTIPCQVLIIWKKSQPEFQLIIITKLKEMEDKFIEVFECTENEDVVEFIENKVMKESIIISNLITKIGKDKIENYLFLNLLYHLEFNYTPLKSYPKKFLGLMMRVPSIEAYCVGWCVYGNILNLKIDEIIEDFKRELEKIKKNVEFQHHPISTSAEKKKMYGAWIYPPLWIGEKPEPKSLKEKIQPIDLLIKERETVLETLYKGRALIMKRNGFIAIEAKNKKEALKLLNEIMGTLFLFNIYVEPIRINDICELIIENGREGILIPLNSSRNILLSYTEASAIKSMRDYSSLFRKNNIIDLEKIKNLLKISEILTSKEEIRHLLFILLEANSKLKNGEYLMSFLSSWIVIENYIKKRLENILDNEAILEEKEAKYYKQNLHKASISRLLEILRIITKIKLKCVSTTEENEKLKRELEEYSIIKKMIKIRNDAVHKGIEPSKEDCERIFSLVLQKIKDYSKEVLENYRVN